MPDDEPPRRPRARNSDTSDLIAAREALRDYVEKLGGWAEQTARLRATRHLRWGDGERAEIARVRALVLAAHAEFAQMRAAQPEKVGRHSVMQDAERSFSRLLEQLDALE